MRAAKQLISACLLVLTACGSANASIMDLISVDYLASGDQKITRDTIAGRDWLDLTLSTNYSYNELVGASNDCMPTCTSGAFSGWTFASEVDVKGFLTNAGLAPYSSTDDLTSGLADDIGAFIDLLGPSFGSSSNKAVQGITRSTFGNSQVVLPYVVWRDSSSIGDQAGTFGGSALTSSESETFGVWFFRTAPVPAPTPATIALIGLGLVGISFSRPNKIKAA